MQYSVRGLNVWTISLSALLILLCCMGHRITQWNMENALRNRMKSYQQKIDNTCEQAEKLSLDAAASAGMTDAAKRAQERTMRLVSLVQMVEKLDAEFNIYAELSGAELNTLSRRIRRDDERWIFDFRAYYDIVACIRETANASSSIGGLGGEGHGRGLWFVTARGQRNQPIPILLYWRWIPLKLESESEFDEQVSQNDRLLILCAVPSYAVNTPVATYALYAAFISLCIALLLVLHFSLRLPVPRKQDSQLYQQQQ